MDSLNCLSYKRLVILHKLRCANCVTKILYFFHTTKLSVPVFSNFCLHTDLLFVPNYRIIEFQSHGISRTVTDFSFFSPNFRIIEFLSSHGISRTVTDFLFFFSCPELSNFNHMEYRGRSRIFFSSFLVPNFRIFEFYLFVPRLVLCPELSNFCLP